jgi:hypothetical protein
MRRRAARRDHRMLFDLIDPVAMVFLLLAVLGLMLAVAYGKDGR